MTIFDIDITVYKVDMNQTVYKIITNFDTTAEKLMGFQQIDDLTIGHSYSITPIDQISSSFELKIEVNIPL